MDYRRAVRRANLTLLGVFAAFTATLPLRHFALGRVINLGLEAAMVAGVADWFAVTALFRRPLGIPFHTAIIPRARTAIFYGVVNMVETQLLSREHINRKISQVDLAQPLLQQLDHPDVRESLMAGMEQWARQLLGQLDRGQAAAAAAGQLKLLLKEWNLVPFLISRLEIALEHGCDRHLIDWVLREMTAAAAKPAAKESIYNLLRTVKGNRPDKRGIAASFRQAGFSLLEHLGAIDLEAAAARLQAELISTLTRLTNPTHPLRQEIQGILYGLPERLRQDQRLAQSIEKWKAEVIDHLNLHEPLETLIRAIQSAPDRRTAAPSPIFGWANNQFAACWNAFSESPDCRQTVDGILKGLVAEIVEQHHQLIGEVVANSLQAWSNAALIEFIQNKVGPDLQYVRNTGVLVGGLAGMLIGLFGEWIYGPLIRYAQAWF